MYIYYVNKNFYFDAINRLTALIIIIININIIIILVIYLFIHLFIHLFFISNCSIFEVSIK